MRHYSIWDTPETASYHKTVEVPVQEAIEREDKCRGQEDKILSIFREFKSLSPAAVYNIYKKRYQDVPLTSIRRGMSNLKKKDILEKTEELTKGLYGHSEHIFKLKP